jgi:four helix bundle protein
VASKEKSEEDKGRKNMEAVRSYQELKVWQKSMKLAEAIYVGTRKFPREETYGLTAQLRGAAVSVAANIAEGQARNTKGEFKQFLGIAKGSLAELETEVMLATRVNLMDAQVCESLLAMCDEVGKMLSGLQKALAAKKD